MSNRKAPDFFGILESTAAILAGLQAAVWLYRQLPLRPPRASVARALHEVADLVRYIEVDVQVITEVVAEAQVPGDRLYRPGRYAFLSKDQFNRYDKTADQLFARLRRVVRATHRIARDLPAQAVERVGTLSDATAHFERILNDRNQAIDTVINDLTVGTRSLKGVLQELSQEEPDREER